MYMHEPQMIRNISGKFPQHMLRPTSGGPLARPASGARSKWMGQHGKGLAGLAIG